MFSLCSNGRIDGMMKFEELEACKGLEVCWKSDEYLLDIHRTVYIKKKTNIRPIIRFSTRKRAKFRFSWN